MQQTCGIIINKFCLLQRRPLGCLNAIYPVIYMYKYVYYLVFLYRE